MGSTKDGIDRGFASVLRWREGERDILVQEMRLIESKIHTITSQRTQREKMLVELQHVARLHREGELSVVRLLEQHQYELRLVEIIQSLEGERLSLEVESRRHREKLIDAELEIKKIEKLLEKRQVIQREQTARRDQQAIDDAASVKFWKRRRERVNQ